MQPRLLKTQNAEYIVAEFDGTNHSGYRPAGDRVLILVDQATDKTKGGVYISEEITERQTMATETGVIVASGPDAFLWNSDRTRKWEGEKPKIGDRIFMQRYSGQVLMGADGKMYRLIDDVCVGAVADAEVFGALAAAAGEASTTLIGSAASA